ncbi:hypothetical protein DC498_13600 [Terrimonas sp.]|nr:hypothetical protein DC498_13600 [Terrimonas sp.]
MPGFFLHSFQGAFQMLNGDYFAAQDFKVASLITRRAMAERLSITTLALVLTARSKPLRRIANPPA